MQCNTVLSTTNPRNGWCKTMDVFVTVCHYDGCEECGGNGSHVVGVFLSEKDANAAGESHKNRKDVHYGHFFYCEVEKHVASGTTEA